MGEVWAVDGDRFYVASGGAVVLWIDGAPAEVVYRPPDRYASDANWLVKGLWGAGDELIAMSTSQELRVSIGGELLPVPAVSGQEPVFYVRGGDIWAVATLDGADYSHWRVGIFHRQDGGWSLEDEIDNFEIQAIGGDPATGLWIAGSTKQRSIPPFRSTPMLLRRSSAAWETADSTYLGYVSEEQCLDPCTSPCAPFTCVGDVYQQRAMWIDPDGRAHVLHAGSGILVHDGTQSWMEEAPDRFSRVDVSPDGTVYAVRSGGDGAPGYMWIHSGTGWQGTELWAEFDVWGLSAFDGGAIAVTCSYEDADPDRVGCSPVRFWPDGTWYGLHFFPL